MTHIPPRPVVPKHNTTYLVSGSSVLWSQDERSEVSRRFRKCKKRSVHQRTRPGGAVIESKSTAL